MLQKAYGKSTSLKTRAYEWYSPFKIGRKNVVEDLPCSGRPLTSPTEVKGVFTWIGRISKRFLEFYCEKTIIDFLMRFLLKVLLTLRLQNSENLYEKIGTVWPLHPCEHRQKIG